MIWRARQVKKAGEHFTEPTDVVSIDLVNLPNFWISILPLLIVIITLNALHWNIILSHCREYRSACAKSLRLQEICSRYQ